MYDERRSMKRVGLQPVRLQLVDCPEDLAARPAWVLERFRPELVVREPDLFVKLHVACVPEAHLSPPYREP